MNGAISALLMLLGIKKRPYEPEGDPLMYLTRRFQEEARKRREAERYAANVERIAMEVCGRYDLGSELYSRIRNEATLTR